MFEEFMYGIEEDDHKRKNKTKQVKLGKVDDQRMAVYANHALHVAQRNQTRFGSNQFGYTLANNSVFILHDFQEVLNRYMRLEAYCDAVDDYSPFEDYETIRSEPDIFQAVYHPRSIAPRTPMKPVALTQMTEQTLSAMWFRLVSHYYEWLTGVSELKHLTDTDKVRLTVCQLCKVICFSVVYANYDASNQGDEDLLFFGSGFYWDPARGNDPLMDDYCQEMKRIINQVIRPVKMVRMTKEEFVLVKLILLFDSTNLMGISPEGLELSKSMCNKYREVLSRFVRFNIEKKAASEGWSEKEIAQNSVERMRKLLDLPMGVEKLGKLDDESLAGMVESNYGGMRGRLQQEIHTESKKIRNH